MTGDFMEQVRTRYAAVVDLLLALGATDHARECAELAARRGVWKDALQRPTSYDDTLPTTPLYPPADFWFVRYLEERFETIRDEVLAVVDPHQAGFSRVEEPLVGRGRWDEVIFYEDGIRMARSCDRFPTTAAIMEAIPEAVQSGGVVMLSWLHPRSHIVPHCGRTNTKLRVHFALKVPEGASMRVGASHVIWQEGKCLVFDDSFEHEVWNEADEPRIVLLFDVIHPGLPRDDYQARRTRRTDLADTVTQFLTSHGIAGVERDPATDELMVFPDESTALTIARYMRDHNVTRVHLANGRLIAQ